MLNDYKFFGILRSKPSSESENKPKDPGPYGAKVDEFFFLNPEFDVFFFRNDFRFWVENFTFIQIMGLI